MQKINKENLHTFLNEQKENWPLAKMNYSGLEKVEEKEFQFEGFKIKVQFNPERIKSTAAKIGKDDIQKEPVFFVKKTDLSFKLKLN